MRLKVLIGISLISFVLSQAPISAALIALEPEQGGVDYQIQGEYTGKIETAIPFAAQVVALGGGKFHAVFFPDGLPGAGWKGQNRSEVDGSLQGDTAVFSGSGFSASVAADGLVFSGKTSAGEWFSLNKLSRKSPTLDAPAPAGAVILFDGKGVAAWKDGTASMDNRQLFKPEGASASSGAITKQAFKSFTMHLEFREPFMPEARGQRRGNSGIYLVGRDELQIVDSFGAKLDDVTDTMAAKRECGAFFEYFRPSINMAFPPLAWQTYDIEFTSARYDAGGKTMLNPAIATVKWNGVTVQENRNLVYSTLLGDPQGSEAGPMRFQAYGDPVYYRNIWVTEGGSSIKRRLGGIKPSADESRQLPVTWARLDGRRINDLEKISMRIWGY